MGCEICIKGEVVANDYCERCYKWRYKKCPPKNAPKSKYG